MTLVVVVVVVVHIIVFTGRMSFKLYYIQSCTVHGRRIFFAGGS